VSLWILIVTTPEAVPCRCSGQVGGEETGNAKRCVEQRILKSAGGTWNRSRSSVMTARLVGIA
jgi:hypothetical protein